MKIIVKLHGILRDYRPPHAKIDQFEIEVDETAVVRQAIEHFGIPPQRVHAVFVNDEDAQVETPLHPGDFVRLFPPVVGGSDRAGNEPWRVFIGGIMQGSRRENVIDAQDYRHIIGQCLRSHLPNVEVIDPFELHPNSVAYDTDEARRTLIALAQTAGQSDAAVVYVPEASMGTALEMWEAYRDGKPIFAISPLVYNWVIRCLATRVFADLEEFCAFVASGDFERSLRSAAGPRNVKER
ncbi:MAG TPA: MoaD/ThiS family protein [Anaerolineae bacterium]|nr:MoaD/ThiS family protein [Anaerolineae bacterium]